MTRLLVFLLILSVNLSAQLPNWQTYSYISGFNQGVDFGETIWLSSYYSIVKYDQSQDELEIFSIADFGIDLYLRDMVKGKNGQLYFLSGQQGQIVEWNNGETIKWTIPSLLIQNPSYNIIGEIEDGVLLLVTSNGRIIRVDKEEGATFMNLPNGLSGSVTDAVLLDDGNLIAWGYQHVVSWDKEGEIQMILNLEEEIEYVYKAGINEDGSVWVLTGIDVKYWSPISNVWLSINTTDLTHPYPNKINVLSDGKLLVSYNNWLMDILSIEDQSIQVEHVSIEGVDLGFSPYSAFLDDEDRFWYLNYKNHLLTSWDMKSAPVPIEKRPWMPVSNVHAINQDAQGKIWVGGNLNIAYLLGGDWHSIPVFDPFSSFTSGINEIEFTSDNRPIIGAGMEGFFGASPSFVFEWNGQVWDTLHDATLGFSAFPITDLEIDKDQNLWVLRDFDNIFSVRSKGQWLRFKTSDMPINANIFTFLEEGPDDKMWIGTDKGIVIYDGYTYSSIDTSTLSLQEGFLNDICFDDKGQIWVTTSNSGIRKWTGAEWEVLDPDLMFSNSMNEIIQGVGDEMWVVLNWDGVAHFDGEEWEQLTPANSGLVESQVLSVFKDTKDRIWFGSPSSISILHPGEKTIVPFHLANDQKMSVYPNPGCCLYGVHWEVEQETDAALKLINTSGQLVREWQFENLSPGEHQFEIKQDNLPPATYYIQLWVGKELSQTIPLIVVE